MASYPTAIWSPPVRGTNLSDAVTQTDILDAQNAEIVAMQTEGGTAPSGTFSTITARFDGFSYALCTASAITDNMAVRVSRNPMSDGKWSVTIFGSCRNNKGSAMAAADDVLTVPAGYRPVGGNSLMIHNISGNVVAAATITSGGLVEVQAGATGIANLAFISLYGSWITV